MRILEPVGMMMNLVWILKSVNRKADIQTNRETTILEKFKGHFYPL